MELEGVNELLPLTETLWAVDGLSGGGIFFNSLGLKHELFSSAWPHVASVWAEQAGHSYLK